MTKSTFFEIIGYFYFALDFLDYTFFTYPPGLKVKIDDLSNKSQTTLTHLAGIVVIMIRSILLTLLLAFIFSTSTIFITISHNDNSAEGDENLVQEDQQEEQGRYINQRTNSRIEETVARAIVPSSAGESDSSSSPRQRDEDDYYNGLSSLPVLVEEHRIVENNITTEDNHDYDRVILPRSKEAVGDMRSLNSEPTHQPSAVNILSCPPVGSSPIHVTPGSVMLNYSDALCTLTKSTISETGMKISIPIAISYDSNPWEQSAGEFASSLLVNNHIPCYSNGCQIDLSPLDAGELYVLSTLDYYTLSENDEYARFLETATFGITQEQLDAFENSPASVHEDITAWISDQMNSTITPLTSHREFWRSGLNGRVRLFGLQK